MSSKQEIQMSDHPILQSYSISTELPFKIVHSQQRKERKYQRDGHWNQRQKLKYTIFLTHFRQLFSDPIKKKSVKIYDMMADMIITRTSNQCRSHHQKIAKYRSNITDIIASVAEKYEPRVYKELEERYLVFIKILLENRQKYTRFCLGQKSNDFAKQNESKIKNQSLKKLKKSNVIASNHQDLLEEGEVEYKMKIQAGKTADSYSEGEQQVQNREAADQIPVMTLHEQRLNDPEGLQAPQALNQNYLMYYGYQPNFTEPIMIPSTQEIQMNTQNKYFLEEQIRMLQIKRQWHIRNSQILSSQLATQKQLIQSCENVLQHYRSVLNSQN